MTQLPGSLFLSLLLACGGEAPPTPVDDSPAPTVAPVADAGVLTLEAWERIVATIGTHDAPRALMDNVSGEVLGLHTPLRVAQTLESFVATWGVAALGSGPPTSSVITDGVATVKLQGTGPDGQPVLVVLTGKGGKLSSMGVDPRPGRTVPVFTALEVSRLRMAAAAPEQAAAAEPEGAILNLPRQSGAAPDAYVYLKRIEAHGGIDQDKVHAGLGTTLDTAAICHTKRLADGATLAGSMGYRIEIAADGSTTKVNRQGNALDLTLDTCVRKDLQALTYEGIESAGAIEITLNFFMPEPPEEPPEPVRTPMTAPEPEAADE